MSAPAENSHNADSSDTGHADTQDLPLVHAVNVMKSFHDVQVLKGIDMDVHKGQVICLLGPSGSGKTTFLRCINQLETIDGGRIWVDGDLMGYEDRGVPNRLHLWVPAACVDAGLARGDWRVALMASLVDYDAFEGEWDPERHLIIPRADGPLARVGFCRVAGCSHLRHGASALCSFHRRQFAATTATDLEAWLESSEPGAQKRRWFCEELCLVGADGQRCLRPAVGANDLCRAHDAAWRGRQAAPIVFEKFLTEAHPLPGYGPCAAASCYLGATHGRTGLCEAHDRIWRAEGLPTGRAFTSSWATRVRQPSNGRVLSLRGLPELVRLELLYVIGCRVRDQIRTTTNVHPYLDRLRAGGVCSLLDYDLAHVQDDREQNYARFARYSLDRVRLAYVDPDSARQDDVWDLRLFARSGHKRLDFR